jgi:hypothetical protein
LKVNNKTISGSWTQLEGTKLMQEFL